MIEELLICLALMQIYPEIISDIESVITKFAGGNIRLLFS